MNNTLYLDLETYNETPIKAGVYKYAETAEIMIVAFALDDAPVTVWDVTADMYLPEALKRGVVECSSICAHFSTFDRIIFGRSWAPAKLKPWRDTMIRALAHGLPGSLGQLSEIFRLPTDIAKEKEGRKLIHMFCKPQSKSSKIERATRETHGPEWAEFLEYAGKDIKAMRELDRLLPRWNDTLFERSVWALDQRINDRGFRVDVDLAEAAQRACKIEKAHLDKKTQELTKGEIQAATQRDALLKHILNSYGVALPDMQSATLKRRISDVTLPQPLRELLELRLQSSRTSTSKYNTLLKSVCKDKRLRGTLQFCGAPRTGRWAGRLFQPHNMPRPQFKNDIINVAIEALKLGCIDLIHGDVSAILSSAIRGALIATRGKKLVASDLKSIEGRALAWLAKEEWKLNAYRDFDIGMGFDLYVLTYAHTFGVTPESVDKEQRQLGKVLELAMGYGGGVGAFITLAAGYNFDMENMAYVMYQRLPADVIQAATRYWHYCVKEHMTLGLPQKTFVTCDAIKRLWRAANPCIASLWQRLESGFQAVLTNPEPVKVGCLTIDKKGTWLRIRLPSGRYLCYPGARVVNGTLQYLGINTYSKKWGPLSTYGGKLAENVTQSFSRDILADGMLNSDIQGYDIVLSVHDELITETPDTPDYSAEQLSELMSIVPDWATGLPLAAEGFESYRYRKG